MKNLPEVKLGIIVGSTDWMPQEVAITQRSKLIDLYNTTYGIGQIYECPVCITDNEISIKRALKDIQKNECNALCIYYANYGPESAGTLLAQEFSGPVMFFAAAEEEDMQYHRKDAMSGFINACYALKLRNSSVYIPSRPIGTLRQCVEMLVQFFPIARTLIAINNLKVIAIGPRPSSYLAASAPNHLLYNLGIEVAEYSELELFNSYNKHAQDTRIDKIVDDMVVELGDKGNKYPTKLQKYAQYELTIEDWIRNHKGNRKFITVTSTCWPAFPVNFGFVPCYVNSRLTSKGIPIACEVDIYGAVSEYIAQSICDDSVAILNLNNSIPQSVYESEVKGKDFNGVQFKQGDLFLGYHCGVTSSTRLKSCSSELHYVNNLLLGEEKSTGTLHGQIISGQVTIFRLQAMRDNKLRAYIAQGEILPIKIDTYGGYGVFAIPEFERFLRNVIIEKQFPNHTIVLFGHYAEQLYSVLSLLGIDEIEYNHPREIPYPKENPYSKK